MKYQKNTMQKIIQKIETQIILPFTEVMNKSQPEEVAQCAE